MVATTIELEKRIRDFVSSLQEDFPVEAVILFGSYVNGKPDEWSDIDIAVISPAFEGKRMTERQRRISRSSRASDVRIAPIGYPSSEYHNPGPHSFLREIILTGRVVYGAESTAASQIRSAVEVRGNHDHRAAAEDGPAA